MPNLSENNHVLIGVGVWSRYDLELLDRLQATLAEHPPQVVIYVFDVDEFRSLDDLESRLPGIGRPCATPIVGVWRNGVLQSTASGFKGGQLLAQIGLLA